ncbi:MAG: DUF1573 domain-containing protein [Chitinophagaceae bacterium]|nr:DUF1573 domain-containing protein [Chitinophagaceae bacterium]
MKKTALFIAGIALTVSVMAQTSESTKQTQANKAKLKQQTTEVKTVAVPVQAAANQPSPDDVIKMNTVKHDFGKIKQGVPVNYSFEIKNTSNKPIVVENSYASCGCTTPEKIVEPIAPGGTAKLKVQYNAANPGAFTKDVHIKLAGIAQEKIVQITGEVVAEAPKN